MIGEKKMAAPVIVFREPEILEKSESDEKTNPPMPSLTIKEEVYN